MAPSCPRKVEGEAAYFYERNGRTVDNVGCDGMMGQSVVDRVIAHGTRPAIVDPSGMWSYDDLASSSQHLAARLMGRRSDFDEERIAILCIPGRDFVVATLACWRAGGLAVPLNPTHPDRELVYALDEAEASIILASPSCAELGRRVASGRRLETVTEAITAASAPRLPVVDPDRAALMIFTSGTTGRPKGAVHTHRSVAAQVKGLIDAWEWVPDDRILLVLPLHHVHGIVNVTCCALWAGAVCEAPGGFDAIATWERLASGALTLFMAVPTIYNRLIAAWDEASDEVRRSWAAGARRLRLMVSGSAALPVSTLARWEGITGQVLLERYGMTEIGMALSNTLDRRVAGHVGIPLPGIEVRIVDDLGHDVDEGSPGELLVRGEQVFREYWGRPDATTEAFDDGWFRTGDVAVCEPDGYRLLGRSSVDIIKTGGEKVSALEIEETYREHAGIVDCAVVGVPDDEWGQRVCAAVVAMPLGPAPTPQELRVWGKDRLAAAKVPTQFMLLDELPRNAMGKVTKPAVAALFTS